MSKLKCVLCDKEKEAKDIIKGIKGNICRDCVAVCTKEKPQQERGFEDLNAFEKLELSKSPTPLAPSFEIPAIKEKIDELVVGQEKPKQQLIMELYKRYKVGTKEVNNVLLVGNSGVGKTHIIRSFARLIEVPFLEVDATTFSEAGYKGAEVANMLDGLIEQTNGNKEQIERAIVFIDEIDKLTTSSNHTSGQKVQQALLKLVEGTTLPYEHKGRKGIIDTGKIMFVAAGACVGLNDLRKERMRPARTVGFRLEHNPANQDPEFTGEDLIEFGFIPELVGRFPLIIELTSLKREDIRTLLTTHPDSMLKKAGELFANEGIKLDVTEADIDRLTDECMNSPLGVRGISHALTRDLNQKFFDAVLNNEKTVPLSYRQKNENELEL